MKLDESGQLRRLQAAEFLVDANVFLEVALGQQKANACEGVLRKFQRGELEGIVLDFAIDTIVIVMENYGKEWDDIRAFLSGFLGYKGLRVCSSTLLDKIKATNHAKNLDLDFDDALAFQAMKTNEITNVISYDKDFDAVPGIRRLLPEDLLQEPDSD
jgi:predicted nucleic acid-binding protein